jgi:hypothetical protein
VEVTDDWAAGDMFIARVAFADEFKESVTNTLTVESPAPAAVPAIVPVCEFIASPAGKFPDVVDQCNGGTPPVTERGAE